MAGSKYEVIRFGLIKMLVRRGCHCAEELADETITRVVGKVERIADTYVGDPAPYFYGVAQNVFMEYTRKRPQPLPRIVQSPLEDLDNDYECLEECLKYLSPESRWLIREYYQEDKKAKVDRRKQLAEQLGVTQHTLRMRAHRIKSILKKCILDCVGQGK